jgi:UDP-2,3-diacylglucosamine pyrophosphatase LpxH
VEEKLDIRYVDTVIVSDIHLGSEVSRAKALVRTLEGYRFKRLILLGDVFDDMNFHRLRKQHWAFLSYIRKLSSEKRGIEIVWIVGNHDTLLAEVTSHLLGINVFEEYIWEHEGVRYLAIHGHQFDSFLVKNKVLGDIASWIYLVIQKLDRKQRLSRLIKRMSKSWLRLSEKVSKLAAEYARKNGIHAVFCGHTHQAMRKEFGSVMYYNTGCWTDIPSTFIVIDRKEVKIIEVGEVSSEATEN